MLNSKEDLKAYLTALFAVGMPTPEQLADLLWPLVGQPPKVDMAEQTRRNLERIIEGLPPPVLPTVDNLQVVLYAAYEPGTLPTKIVWDTNMKKEDD